VNIFNLILVIYIYILLQLELNFRPSLFYTVHFLALNSKMHISFHFTQKKHASIYLLHLHYMKIIRTKHTHIFTIWSMSFTMTVNIEKSQYVVQFVSEKVIFSIVRNSGICLYHSIMSSNIYSIINFPIYIPNLLCWMKQALKIQIIIINICVK
jgi:hypothetical protein